MSEREERVEKRQRKDSSSSSSSVSSSTSSCSSAGGKKGKQASKYDRYEETKTLKGKEDRRSSPDKREGSKSHYEHRTRHKERDRKRERTRSRSKDRKRERSFRRSKSPGYRHSSHRHSRKDYDRVRRRSHSRSRSHSFDRSVSRKSYNKSLKKLNMLEKLGIELKVPEGQPTVAQSTQLPGGVTIPSYYNPAGVNPLKYVQQMQKRKLLWGNSQKSTTQTSTDDKVEEKGPVGPETVWKGTSFSNDQDGKLTAKFKRLMGIKVTEDDKSGQGSGSSLIKKQEEIFESMEKQYEVARVATHTHRGLGLGFGVHQPR